MFASIPKVQETIGKIARILEERADGVEMLWEDIEKISGISMDPKGPGRGYVRRALKLLRRPYEAVRAQGIRLSAPNTAMTIIRGRVVRVDGALRVAARTQRQLQERHLEQMTSDEQRRMLMAAGFFGAIRAMAKENSVKLFK
jgi:hypothetical protein